MPPHLCPTHQACVSPSTGHHRPPHNNVRCHAPLHQTRSGSNAAPRWNHSKAPGGNMALCSAHRSCCHERHLRCCEIRRRRWACPWPHRALCCAHPHLVVGRPRAVVDEHVRPILHLLHAPGHLTRKNHQHELGVIGPDTRAG